MNEHVPFGRRMNEIVHNPKQFVIEHALVKYSVLSFVLLCVVELLAYFAFWRTLEFLSAYGWWIFYVNVAVVSVCAGLWHLKSYHAQVSCMVGMMIGMTLGMQTGMMVGTIIGFTNGLFVGGIVGMLLAVVVGVYAGSCCGIMGVMEGMMAGIMGGVMGSMIGTMFRVDHILWFMPVFMVLNVSVMGGLSYMIVEELCLQGAKKKEIGFWSYLCYCLVFAALLVLVMVYGPKTGLAKIG